MAVTLETTIKRFRGLSTDTKPTRLDEDKTPLPVGSVFTEEDTGHRYKWDGSWPWVRQEQTIETMFSELVDLHRETLSVLKATHQGHEEYTWGETVEVESEL